MPSGTHSTPKPAATYSQLLGQVVLQHRKARGLTQAQFADLLQLTQSGYSRLERGDTHFTAPQLRRAAEALGVMPAALLKVADDAARRLASQGVTVLDDRPKEGAEDTNGWLWVAAAVLVAAVLFAKGKR
jgi:transcriptional regulator with XRE-family HTH domain